MSNFKAIQDVSKDFEGDELTAYALLEIADAIKYLGNCISSKDERSLASCVNELRVTLDDLFSNVENNNK